ncbi:MAG: MoaD/ThiS family protein [Treponema sp.]|nr:MoaD/ThiS family protein [Treponema sp.]MCL2267263.1 MoaD/ThiS family protein [Treponema sp.]
MIKILIPYALRSFTERNAEVEVEGKTAGEALNALAGIYPDIKNHIFADNGQPSTASHLRDFINLFIDGKNINTLQGLDTPVADNGEIMIIPAIAGGMNGVRT